MIAFDCAVIAVHDGDTLRCAGGRVVRLAGIDAPEIGPCRGRPGRTCVAGDARASRRQLVAIAARRTLRCRAAGVTYGRIAAWCETTAGVDLSCAMIRSGHAIRWDRYWRGHRCG